MRRYLFFAIAGITLPIICLSVWHVSVVRVKLPRTGDRLLTIVRVGGNDRICLTYRHSVELITVEGCFLINPQGDFLAFQTRMESVGTGLPNADKDRTRLENGWIVVDEELRPVGPIRFFIMPVNQTRLTIAARHIPVERLEAGTLIQVEAMRTSALSWLWGAAFSHFTFQRTPS